MNRKKMLFLNSSAVLLTTMINVVFGMVEVSLFISKYGASINGLKQTGTQLLSYLALIESGIGASYVYSLYKPLANNDKKRVAEIYRGFQKSIRIAVIEMLVVALAVSFLYPIFLKNNGLSYLFMVSVFSLLSIKAIMPYLISYVPKYMIIAKEQKYKTELITGVSNAFIYICEMVLILNTNVSIQVLLVICITISLITGLIYLALMKRIYSFHISKSIVPDFTPKKMSKDVLAHNISGLVFNSTDNVIISIFTNLVNVTIYSNYNLIISQVSSVFQSVYDGITASLGIKIAKKDANSFDVYRNLLSITFVIAALISTVFYVMINDFITLWVGKEYVVDYLDVFLWGMILYCGILLPCITSARNACGLYKESKTFTIIQAMLNLGISLALTPVIGITGALLGTLIARVVISVPFNYLLVQRKIFPDKNNRWTELLYGCGIAVVLPILERKCIVVLGLDNRSSLWGFVLTTIVVSIVSIIVIVFFYYLFDSSFRVFINNIIRKNKREN